MTSNEIYKLVIENDARVITDSRVVAKGDIFFALKGEKFDGNKYAASALKNGALYALVDDSRYESANAILVDNTLTTLQEIATIHRKKLGIPVLAITGTNGKTTTKELISRVLSQKYNVHSTRGNLNNHIGLPLTILEAGSDISFLVLEMGANHQGEIASLCNIAKPDYGIITNIGKAHLEGFGSFEGVVSAKSELYSYLAENDGLAIYNEKNTLLKRIVDKLNLKSLPYYKPDEELKMSGFDNRTSLMLDIKYGARNYTIKSNLSGKHNVENIIAALATGIYFGISPESIINAIGEFRADNNRSQLQQTKNNLLLCDAYNANPDSTKLSLDSFFESENSSKVVILGDMLELGKFSIEEHRLILELLIGRKDVDVFLVGPVFCEIAVNTNYKLFADTEFLIEYLKTRPLKDSYILIKGSRGIGLERIYPFL